MSPLLWRLGSQAGCLCRFASVGAAEVAGEDAEGFAVFGDGAAGDADPAFGEEACDVFVAEGMSSARAVLTLVLERCSPSSVARPEVKK